MFSLRRLCFVMLVGLGLCLMTVGQRKERSVLIYPNGGVVRLILLMVIPASKYPAINLVNSLQLVYADPRNVSQLTPYAPFIERRSSSAALTRDVAYDALERALDRRGINGSACLLRTICEVAETPLHHNGLLGEILHLFFTPRLNASENYGDARRLGMDGADCQLSYPSCHEGHGLLDLISMVDS